jgi:hypothetical protein
MVASMLPRRPTPTLAACCVRLDAARLKQEYQESATGSATVGGSTFVVTHPQTQLGWQSEREHTIKDGGKSCDGVKISGGVIPAKL